MSSPSGPPFDVAVIGLGAMGAASVYQATLRGGLRVLGLEARPMGHRDGSSHGESRLTRQAYAEGAMYVPMALAAHREWDQFAERECGGTAVLHRSGVVYMSSDVNDPLVRQSADSARQHGVPGVELWSDAYSEVSRRFANMHAAQGDVGVWEPGAGWLECDNIRRVMVERARERGASLHYECPVRAWERTTRGTYRITTAGGSHFEARRVILCAGSWTHKLVPSLALHPKRRVLYWYQCTPGMSQHHPGFMAQRGPFLLYGFPPVNGLVKVGLHYDINVNKDQAAAPLDDCDPDTVSRDPSVENDRLIVDTLMRDLFPKIGPCVKSAVCLYTCTDDGHFVLDKHPSDDGVVVGAGFSGHGFKFSIVIGRILVDMALGIESEFDLAPFKARL